jgi:hypothetical protein
MFEGLKRLFRRIENALDAPDSTPRPQRVDPDPPKNDWFARTRKRSLARAAKNESAALDKLDEMSPRLSRDAAKEVDDVLARATANATANASRR